MKVILPFLNRKKHGWKFNRERIEKFCEGYNIEFPIRFFRWRFEEIGGEHFFTGKTHFVKIETTYDRFNANFVLLHEICHAIQAEKFPSAEEWENKYIEAGGNYYSGETFYTNPFEKEANNFAFEHQFHFLLDA